MGIDNIVSHSSPKLCSSRNVVNELARNVGNELREITQYHIPKATGDWAQGHQATSKNVGAVQGNKVIGLLIRIN